MGKSKKAAIKEVVAKPVEKKVEEVKRATNLNEAELKVYDNIVDILTNEPTHFSAKWSTGMNIDSSVRHKDGNVSIMLNGSISKPYEFDLTGEEKSKLAELIKPIVERNKQEILSIIKL